jgi:hypothetical protein
MKIPLLPLFQRGNFPFFGKEGLELFIEVLSDEKNTDGK